MRVLVRPPLGLVDADRTQPVDGPGERRSPAQALVVPGDLGELPAHPLGRVERRHRVLEHHRERGAEQAPLFLAVWPQEIAAEQLEPLGVHASGSPTSRATARAVSDLPEPDSPTTPTASPRRMEKLTPRTGRTGPDGPGKVTQRSRTSSTTLRRRGLRGDVRPPFLARGRDTDADVELRQRPATADSQATRDRLAEQVERKPRDHHGDPGGERCRGLT